MIQAIFVAAILLLSGFEAKTFASDDAHTLTKNIQPNATSGIKFGCPAQGCPPPGTGKFGCPAQGCSPPGTGKFGCPAQGCRVDNVPLQPNQTVRSADGTNYRVQYSGVLVDMRTGAQVRVLSNVNGVLYLSNGRHIFVSAQPGTQPVNPNGQPRNAIEIKVGSFVKPIKNANIYTGTTVVGQVYPDERYEVYQMQTPWIALKARDNSILSGWVQIGELVVANEQ